MEYTEILFETDVDHVCTITINRPEKLNTFTPTMMREFQHAWSRIDNDDNIHAVVVRASPGRAFSTGLDTTIGPIEHSNIWSKRDPSFWLCPKQNKVWKPVVTAVHGLACGGAFYFINEADIVICSDDAEFFDPHVPFGRVASLEPIGLTRKVHLGEVLRIALLGNDERVCAETALRIGLVTEITTRENLWSRAHELAKIIAEQPPAAIQGTVRAIWESMDLGLNAAIARGLSYCTIGNRLGMASVDLEKAKKRRANRR